jgi:hypothetical protein
MDDEPLILTVSDYKSRIANAPDAENLIRKLSSPGQNRLMGATRLEPAVSAVTATDSSQLRGWCSSHPQNHPRQSPTILPSCPYFPVCGSPTATHEVVGNTGNPSSEKARRRGFSSLPDHYHSK